jgi:hypothetical protein
MQMPVLLAHGVLGPYDEIIFLGVAAIFVVMMGISWVRSRNVPPETLQETSNPPSENDTPDHISLD